MKKKYTFGGFVACLLVFSLQADADVIKKMTGEEKGTFVEYSNNKFVLKTDKGKTIEVPKASCRELVLDEPVKVTITRQGMRKTESAELLGYGMLQFKLKQNKKTVSLSAMHIKSMKAHVASSFGGGGTAMGDAETAIPSINTSQFDESVMNDSQKSALAKYRSTRKRYDSFLSESTAMVAEMDRSTGQRREELLGKLRIRKNQEQPVRIEMSGAHKGLLAAFPNGFPLKPKAPAGGLEPEMPPQGESAKEVMENKIDLEEGQVLLIDTTQLTQGGNLTESQMKALSAYEKAAVAFEELSAKQTSLANAVEAASDADKATLMPLYEQAAKDASAARNSLLKTQKPFLKAFPQLRLAD